MSDHDGPIRLPAPPPLTPATRPAAPERLKDALARERARITAILLCPIKQDGDVFIIRMPRDVFEQALMGDAGLLHTEPESPQSPTDANGSPA